MATDWEEIWVHTLNSDTPATTDRTLRCIATARQEIASMLRLCVIALQGAI